jgi:hypothetical protein
MSKMNIQEILHLVCHLFSGIEHTSCISNLVQDKHHFSEGVITKFQVIEFRI